jgi:hypothetical protein
MASLGLLLRIFEQPQLVSAVRALPPATFSKLIDRIGLEDAGELVALATAEQLERVFDDDLWKSVRAGADETFRPDRFAVWLEVMSEAGDAHVIRRLRELPQDLLALAVQRLALVVDSDELATTMSARTYDTEDLEDALDRAPYEEWEEFRMIPRDASTWDVVWSSLQLLDRDHHEDLRAILEQCCALTTEFINGNGGLYAVLTSEEMVENDVAAARADRRAAQGFVSPADARAFLALAQRGDALDQRDAITRAYFRELAPPQPATEATAEAPEVQRLVALLGDEQVVETRPLALLGSGSAPVTSTAPRFEAAMRALREHDAVLFAQRLQELGYLVNVVIAGDGGPDGGALRPVEALERVLRACEAGMRDDETLERTSADQLFRRGYRASR